MKHSKWWLVMHNGHQKNSAGNMFTLAISAEHGSGLTSLTKHLFDAIHANLRNHPQIATNSVWGLSCSRNTFKFQMDQKGEKA